MNVYPRNISEGFYFKRKVDGMVCWVVSIQDQSVICLIADGSVDILKPQDLSMLPLDEVRGRISDIVFISGSYYIMLSETLIVHIYDDNRFEAIENNQVIFKCEISIDYVNELQHLIRLKFMPQLKMDFVTYAEQDTTSQLPIVMN